MKQIHSTFYPLPLTPSHKGRGEQLLNSSSIPSPFTGVTQNTPSPLTGDAYKDVGGRATQDAKVEGRGEGEK
jgi:hypothetical protein